MFRRGKIQWYYRKLTDVEGNETKRLPKFKLDCLFIIKLVLIISMILGFGIGISYMNYSAQPDVRYCYIDMQPIHPNRLADVLESPIVPIPDRTIFFHETRCHQNRWYPDSPAINTVNINARQACSIESAALNNPNYSVFVLFSSPAYLDKTKQTAIVEAVQSYSNVHLRNMDLWTYTKDTPVEDFMKAGKIFDSIYLQEHLADFLRFLTLWRYGGIYFDMDTVILKNMEDIPMNFAAAESDDQINNAVMSFASKGYGHELVEKFLIEFKKNFDGHQWTHNGPAVITRGVIHDACNVTNVAQTINKTEACHGFHVYPRQAFYAVPWTEWNHFFEEKYLNQTMQTIKDSILVHIWNKVSKGGKVVVGSNVAYGKFAEKYCPKVYAAAGKYF